LSNNEPLTWDEVFGDLDVRTLSRDERLDLINVEIQRTLHGKTWAAMSGGEETILTWEASVHAFLDGNWAAVILCCHVVCERELAGVFSASLANSNGELNKRWEKFGLGELLTEAAKHNMLPPRLIDELRALANFRKPYGHWRSFIHEDSLNQRVLREAEITGSVHSDRLVERLIVRDATNAMLTTIRIYFGSYSLGGP
jgi:hypothetical protein